MAARRMIKQHGRAVIVSSLLLMVCCQGCEFAGLAMVQRHASDLSLAKATFADQYDPQIASLDADILRLQGKPLMTHDEQATLQSWYAKANDLRTRRMIERAERESGEWASLRRKHRLTEYQFSSWSVYRRWMMTLVGLALLVGAFARFYAGSSHEKWLAVGLVLLVVAALLFGPFMLSAIPPSSG